MRWAMLALVVAGCGERQVCPKLPADAEFLQVPIDGGGLPDGGCEAACPKPPPSAVLLWCAAGASDDGRGQVGCFYFERWCE